MTLRCAVDKTTTANLRAAKLLTDKRSFIGKDGHLYFFGHDKARLRAIVFRISKQKCKSCRKPINWELFEMDHIQGGLGGRCDCLHNLQALCRDCHGRKHVGIRWSANVPGNDDAEGPPQIRG